MRRVSPWLRRLFLAINVFFATVGGLAIAVSLASLSPSPEGLPEYEAQTNGHNVLYVVGSVTMAIAILGAYGAWKENLPALTVFLVCMVVGFILMLGAGIPVAAARPQLGSLMEERWRSLLPLDQAPDAIKKWAEGLQSSLHCCGLFGYEDWGDNVPDSCLCSPGDEQGGCQTIGYKNFMQNLFWKKRSVLAQPCSPLIMVTVRTNADITLAVVITLCILSLLGLVLSSLLIHQIVSGSGGARAHAPSLVLGVFPDQPPAYHRLYNLSE